MTNKPQFGQLQSTSDTTQWSYTRNERGMSDLVRSATRLDIAQLNVNRKINLSST